MAATRTIVAVAIGNSQKSTVIRDSSPATLKGLRPYIKGLISWLANEPIRPSPTASSADIRSAMPMTTSLIIGNAPKMT